MHCNGRHWWRDDTYLLLSMFSCVCIISTVEHRSECISSNLRRWTPSKLAVRRDRPPPGVRGGMQDLPQTQSRHHEEPDPVCAMDTSRRTLAENWNGRCLSRSGPGFGPPAARLFVHWWKNCTRTSSPTEANWWSAGSRCVREIDPGGGRTGSADGPRRVVSVGTIE